MRLWFALALPFFACGEATVSAPGTFHPDAGAPAPDAGGTALDAGETAPDAGGPRAGSRDAGGTVDGGPPLLGHEPAGMSVQIDTGPIALAPPSAQGQSWTLGAGAGVFTMYSGPTPSAYGATSANLTLVPGDTGYRTVFATTVHGGWAPVSWGVSIPHAGTGTVYIRYRTRYSANWTMLGTDGQPAVGQKQMEPRTAHENHVIGVVIDSNPTDFYIASLLQGGTTNNDVPSVNAPPYPTRASVEPNGQLGGPRLGSWHWVEHVWQQESVAGQLTGYATCWVDGQLVYDAHGLGFLTAGAYPNNTPPGWNYLMFNSTFGGAPDGRHPLDLSPPMAWDIDQLYVSTR